MQLSVCKLCHHLFLDSGWMEPSSLIAFAGRGRAGRFSWPSAALLNALCLLASWGRSKAAHRALPSPAARRVLTPHLCWLWSDKKELLPHLLSSVLTLASLDGSDFSSFVGKWFVHCWVQASWKTGKILLVTFTVRVSNLKHPENRVSAAGLNFFEISLPPPPPIPAPSLSHSCQISLLKHPSK